jgi:hypothetical protein
VQKLGCICEAYVHTIWYGMSSQSEAAGVGVVITGEILEPGTLGRFFDGFKARGRGHLRSTGVSSAALASGSGLDRTGPCIRLFCLSCLWRRAHRLHTFHSIFTNLRRSWFARSVCQAKAPEDEPKMGPCSDQLHSLSELSILPPKAACSTDEGLDLPSSYRSWEASCDVNPLDEIR